VLNSHEMSDDEKAEALKRWWSENGKSVVGGIVVGLALVFGWRGYLEHQQSESELASSEYDSFLSSVAVGDVEKAKVSLDILKLDYGSTAYDYFAALEMARLMVEKKDLASARQYLELAVANADQPGMKHLAEVRLARILMASGDNEAASKLVAGNKEGAFAGEFAHIQGDLYRSAGDKQQALTAYEKALTGSASNQALIEMKINQVR